MQSRFREFLKISGFPLDERLGFDDGMLLGEGVEGGQEEAARAGLGGHEAQGSEGESVVGLEVVQQAALAAIGEDLVVDVQEDFGLERLDLEGGLIGDAMSADE